MTNFIFKLNMLLCGRIGAASYLGADGDVQDTIEATEAVGQSFSLMFDSLITLVDRFIYTICNFILNVIELMQFVFQTFLGVSNNIEDYVVLDRRNPLVSFLTNETVLTAFRSILGVAVVLIIVFTIYSIIRSEYNIALDENLDANNKNRIFARSLRSFFILGTRRSPGRFSPLAPIPRTIIGGMPIITRGSR